MRRGDVRSVVSEGRDRDLGFFVRRGLFVFSVLLFVASSVQGVELTSVTHLFDIEHDFSQPSDVAVGPDGSIYVVDGVNYAIKVFDSEGRFQFSFGSHGSGPGQFDYPLGMDIDAAGRLYVADSGNSRIQIFLPDGSFLNEINLVVSNGKKCDPTDVAVDSAGTKAFVVDNENHCILTYDLNTLLPMEVFGKAGIGKIEFRYPFLISKYNDKYLYVVDVINTRVQELTDTGKFVRFIGDWGVEKGQFFRPKGVAVDASGLVYVSDSYMGVVQVFGEGIFHSVIGDNVRGALHRYNSPVGLFVDNKNRLYVVEMFAERVSVFQINRDSD